MRERKKDTPLARGKEISKKDTQFELEELVYVAGGSLDHSKEHSIKDMLSLLRTLIIYGRFDVEATRRELKQLREEDGQ